ncbi:MAG: 30S ribosomal protein S18 [Deltaproteobacteria bacterium CG11_big_fil_rev_8_21_14_0_20_49_13]|nr:MAG: 30S ribosomal protein S18 [Deltaproteobacteria bacterium CG11_big_fil_rev_8_21_14_0_20_49_13]
MPRRFNKDDKKGPRKGPNRFGPQRKRTCRFCADKMLKLDYKNPQQMGLYISERGKILPRRFTGACAKHQRFITLAVKRARILAVVPFSSVQTR